MNINRRRFLGTAACTGLGAAIASGFPQHAFGHPNNQSNNAKSKQRTPREFLRSLLYNKDEVDRWLAGKAFPFAKYNGQLGWLLPNANFRDGIDDSVSAYTFVQPDGERTMSNYADQPCRINTYGDSFTQCHQVSDHETWQEVLAGHIQEPVRNFGIGGWSVYQAYLRMLKEEQRTPAEYIIFNIYDDDHRRNLDSWRNIRVRKHQQFIEPPLPHVRVNPKTGTFAERPNPCPTPQSLYDLCDIDKAWELFKDDFTLQIMLAHANSKTANPSASYKAIHELSTTHGIETSIKTNWHLPTAAKTLHDKAALFSTERIVEKIEAFAKSKGKKVLYVLSYPASTIARRIKDGTRWDQTFVDFLKRKKRPVVDLMQSHLQDFAKYKIDAKQYLAEYYIGHYTPSGNLFCAFEIKDALVRQLDPRPVPYR